MEKYSDLNFGNPKKFCVIEFRVAQREETLTSRFTGKRDYDTYLLDGTLNQTLVFGHRASTPRCPQKKNSIKIIVPTDKVLTC